MGLWIDFVGLQLVIMHAKILIKLFLVDLMSN